MVCEPLSLVEDVVMNIIDSFVTVFEVLGYHLLIQRFEAEGFLILEPLCLIASSNLP